MLSNAEMKNVLSPISLTKIKVNAATRDGHRSLNRTGDFSESAVTESEITDAAGKSKALPAADATAGKTVCANACNAITVPILVRNDRGEKRAFPFPLFFSGEEGRRLGCLRDTAGSVPGASNELSVVALPSCRRVTDGDKRPRRREGKRDDLCRGSGPWKRGTGLA
mmetsp:Transcript_36947/g.72654  ORF Transcript_36947/g.72654 Transcript_36947/m.72654 type:complete len:167 (+) Transcript_36947:1238-1738(+)